MPTGFMSRHFIVLCVLLACRTAPAAAQSDVALIGVIGNSAAVLAIDGGDPRTVKVGQTRQGIKLVDVQGERATIEIQGKTRVLSLGQHHRNAVAAAAASQTVTLAAEPSGHFISSGSINGHSIRFVVDTGATTIAIPASDALRLGIDYRKGTPGQTRTAGGVVPVYRVIFEKVRIGGIELAQVEGIVIEQGLDVALLGMSFLSRVDLRQEGRTMTLIKRF
jgi:aspartyl protease family protein